MECFKKQILLTYICIYWINKIKFYKMHGTYIKMPIQSLVLRNETLWRTSSQPKQTKHEKFHLHCDRKLNIKFSLKHAAKHLLSMASTCFGQTTFNGQNRYEKRQILCNILEMKIYMFVFLYSPKQIFKTFFILINTHANI